MIPTTHSKEWSILLQSCKVVLNPTSKTRQQINLPDTINWDNLLQLAHRQGTFPLLSKFLRQPNISNTIPSGILHKLKKGSKRIAIRNLQLTSELFKIIKLLKAEGVDIIPYKGTILSQLAYGDLSMRNFGDIDFLFKKTDFLKIQNVIVARGYQPELNLPSFVKKLYFSLYCEYNFDFYHERERIFHVEPHWEVSIARYQVALTYDDILPFTKQSNFMGQSIRLLTPEGLLLTTSLHHGARDSWHKLRYIVDIAFILKQFGDSIDWIHFLKQLNQLRVKNIVLCGIALSVELFAIPIAPILVDSCRTKRVQQVMKKLKQNLFTEAYFDPANNNIFLNSLMIHLKLRAYWKTKGLIIFYHFLRLIIPGLEHRYKAVPARTAN